MKKFFVVCGAALLLILGGCSIQISGLDNAYQTPQYATSGTLASLTLATNNASIATIDGKSTRKQSLALSPGKHTITLYVNKISDRSKTAHVLVLTANFKANEKYSIKSKGKTAWIEDSGNNRVSQIVSSMKTTRSFEF